MDSTLPLMAKKKPKQRSPAYVLYVRIKPQLGEALERYIASLRPQPTTTSAIETILEDALTKLGFWPPPDDTAE